MADSRPGQLRAQQPIGSAQKTYMQIRVFPSYLLFMLRHSHTWHPTQYLRGTRQRATASKLQVNPQGENWSLLSMEAEVSVLPWSPNEKEISHGRGRRQLAEVVWQWGRWLHRLVRSSDGAKGKRRTRGLPAKQRTRFPLSYACECALSEIQ